jgi:hypothetical protein
MKLKLKDCRLWDGQTSVYLRGYSFSLKSVGPISCSDDEDVYKDRRFYTAIDEFGVRYILYRSPEGFRHIKLSSEK